MRLLPISFVFYLLLLCATTSCNFTETLAIQPDGTGNYSVTLDGAGIMAMEGKQIAEKIQEQCHTQKLDSTITFKQLIAQKNDSIVKLSPEKQAALKKIESLKMHFFISPEEDVFSMEITTPFKKVSDLQDLVESTEAYSNLQTAESSKKLGFPLHKNLKSNNAKLQFSYDGKKFIRKAILQIPKNPPTEDTLQAGRMLYASSTYILVYSFPKVVKKVSNAETIFSNDRKTITVKYPFLQYMLQPEKLNLIVDFE